MDPDRIRKFLDENPDVYAAFEKEALRVIRKGFEHYSARTIIHYLRHQTAMSADPDSTFKINNDLSPTLARDFLDRHPEAPAGFFEMRGAKTTRKNEPKFEFDAEGQGGLL